MPAPDLLQNATARIIYDLDRFQRTRKNHPQDPEKWLPVYAATLARETHFHDPLPPQGLVIQISFSYSDGFGREIQKKIQAEPGPVEGLGDSVDPRWVGSGWTIFNNKGQPVRQYEPFFSQLEEKRHRYEFGVKVGVSPILFYDPLGRVVATLHPNHTWEKVVFDPWQEKTYDVNDTVILNPQSDEGVKGFFLNPDGTHRLLESEYLPTWYDLRTDPAKALQAWPDVDANGQPLPDNAKHRLAEKEAAEKTKVHADTPTVAHFDSLGRTFLTEAQNRFTRRKPDNTVEIIEEPPYRTLIIFDIEGNQRAVIDAKGRVVMRYDYSVAGPEQDENGKPTNANLIHQASMEAGERWTLNDVAGNPIRAWDSRRHSFRTAYDQLRRPIESYMSEGAGPVLVEQTVYGETRANPEANNLRGQVVQLSDQAGVVTSDEYDFKGNLLRSKRQLAGFIVDPQGTRTPAYKTTVDWSGTVQLENDTYTSHTTYDALNRLVTLTTPDCSIVRPTYNEANLLERAEVNLRGAAAATPFVTNIDYNARGQRTFIRYGNGSERHYQYDPDTFRLIHLYTRRGATFTDDCDNPQRPPPTIAAPEKPPEAKSCGLQNLHYTYDPAGNITHIRDDAQQTIYFRNRRVEPSNDYTYDAIYRLIEATGREHLGQVGGSPIHHSHDDAPRVRIAWSANDGNAMGRYREQYEYDEVGNFTEMIHCGTDPAHPGWTRDYTYDEDSQLESGKKSNRLTSTTIGTSPPELYSTNGDGYDPQGNMLHLPHLSLVQWNFEDQLQATSQQVRNNGTPEITYYVYDAAGQRVRKVTEKATGELKDERIYLGIFEVYRKRAGTHAGLVRETLHVMDDAQRIALVETRNDVDDGTQRRLIRYQLGNHLGSASLELDDQTQIVSYEEYTPYGSTSYHAVRSRTERPKRYRYAGKERDKESGLYYYGARYYAPWLGRWASCDRDGFVDGLNLYQFVSGNPVKHLDFEGRAGITPEQLEAMERKTAAEAEKLKEKLAENNFGSREEALKVARQAEYELLALEETGFWESLNPFVGIPNLLREVSAKTRLAQARYDLVPVEERIGSFSYSPVISAIGEQIAWGAASNVLPVTPAGRNVSKALEKGFAKQVRRTATSGTKDVVQTSTIRVSLASARPGTKEFTRLSMRAMAGTLGETAELKSVWQKATRAARDYSGRGRPFSTITPREQFNRVRKRFWRMVNEGSSPDALSVKRMLETAGFEVQKGNLAPILKLTPGASVVERRLSIDHFRAIANKGGHLNPDNLVFMSHAENARKWIH